MVVADLGSGSGFLLSKQVRLSRLWVKSSGVDIQKDLLERLKNEANRAHVRNIEIICGDLEKLGGTKIREASVDRVIAANVSFYDRRQEKFCFRNQENPQTQRFGTVCRLGRVVSQMGPHPDHVVFKDKAIQLFDEMGFKVEKEISAGSHHYGIIFRKK